MGFVANIRRDVRFARGLFRLLKRIKPIELDSDVLLCDDFEEAVDKFADNIAIDDGQRTLTYRDLDAMANRFAHWAKNRGLRRSDTIALMMTNRIEYLAAWIGFSKVGIATALINTNLNGQGLAHSHDPRLHGRAPAPATPVSAPFFWACFWAYAALRSACSSFRKAAVATFASSCLRLRRKSCSSPVYLRAVVRGSPPRRVGGDAECRHGPACAIPREHRYVPGQA